MAQRFNPPPNWPQPPHADWTPPPGWQPNPTWGPAPEGWALWVEDAPTDGYGFVDHSTTPSGDSPPIADGGAPAKRKKWPIVVGVLAAMVIIGQLTGGEDDDVAATPAATSAPADATTPEPTEDTSADAPVEEKEEPPPAVVEEPAPEPEAAPAYGDRPDDEIQFLDIVTTAQVAARDSDNDMQLAAAKATRDTEMCSLLGGFTVSDWTGKLIELDANGDGKGILAIELADDVEVATWNNFLSDAGDGTLIEPDSPVFTAAAGLSEGQLVRFSGEFIRGSDPDCLTDSRMTLRGGVEDPHFIFRFSEVSSAE